MTDPHNPPYRNGVGLCLFNQLGKVLCAERRDTPGSWQMPQGGVKSEEPLLEAALRELKEEIGTDNAELIGYISEKLSYDFPDYLQYRNGLFRGKYRGQSQIWLALLFTGSDADIKLTNEYEQEMPEFINWRWVELEQAPKLIVAFKRQVYERVVREFMPLRDALRSGITPPTISIDITIN
jgi:putative (di)nucleoside polyphosphate hydrolase